MNKGIELLMKEHKIILEYGDAVRKICSKAMDGEINEQTFRKIIDFARFYADRYHHGKEEQVLYAYMLEKKFPAAQTLVRNGMYVEHDYGRMFVMNIENALNIYIKNPTIMLKLDVLANTIALLDLLKRHIAKEDMLAFPFAQRYLKEEDEKWLNEKTEIYEKEAAKQGTKEKYLAILEELNKIASN